MMVQCCRCPAWQCQADGGSSASIVDEYDGRLSNITLSLHSPQTTINFRCIPAGAECVTISEAALPALQVHSYVPQGPEKGLARESIRCRLRNSTGSSGTRESSLRSSRILILLT